MSDPRFTMGPPRYFRPVCIRHKWGFYGGPSDYLEVKDSTCGPLILTTKDLGLDLQLAED